MGKVEVPNGEQRPHGTQHAGNEEQCELQMPKRPELECQRWCQQRSGHCEEEPDYSHYNTPPKLQLLAGTAVEVEVEEPKELIHVGPKRMLLLAVAQDGHREDGWWC